ncbi:PWWP domain-containing protein 2A isoform X1 [Ixodes scapularis]|uniref:PWWP domain-containing protein 2A isoform X1 n=2 Tax=Ixodes scapularis TaxID=6945 RepID=UPI001161898F|nr:PWWP domain-containing protein 2A isoform X1 [Ixodes scapularis]
MANGAEDEGKLLKGSKISVMVEEALIDVIIVSFSYGGKIFQGALLDVSKKNIPFGISPWGPTGGQEPRAEGTLGEAALEKGDKFHALKQRHTYFQEKPSDEMSSRSWAKSRKTTGRNSRDQSVRMRRLRPRQVLCSHCRAICNENSENVQLGSLKKEALPVVSPCLPMPKCEPEARLPPKSGVAHDEDVMIMQTSPSPRTEESPTRTVYASMAESLELKNAQLPAGAEEFQSKSEYQAVALVPPAVNRMILRKRKWTDADDIGRSSGLVELARPQSKLVRAALTKTSPVIKISFANPQGKGTVVKIPAKLTGPSDTDGDSSMDCVGLRDTSSTRAAKKALKKARRDHHKSPLLASPSLAKHKHHKHKVKRKRRHREPDEPRNDVENSPSYGLDEGPAEGFLGEGRSHKLSISLRRLGAKAYMRCSPKYDDLLASSGSGSECGDVPEFPKLDPLREMDKVKPLMMRISTHNVKRCTLDGGREMAVGDIVWGKIHGFPWWPGKVLALSVSQRDNGATINQQAHVAWFGSSTSSYMPCQQLSPFLDDFKSRYNKKKRGPYKEAIRQATLEAAACQELPPELALL